jgi:hypothetical protein
MIKIIIELHPHGNAEKKVRLAEGIIANDLTGNPQYGNYYYEWSDKGDTIRGTVKKHWRDQSVLALVKKALKGIKDYRG